ncbi:hypothetical protein OTK49_02430 [Vibrio coralliirubri]|uniref:hypothetical protein n=1 Tax=Vibrio coralliirubri TaxID=1516159 RepID=UPI00228519D7|nr:hypothetical protein [Vibrio coralliirubri]MCY9861373.1 hypothetical protein [Vibrio coralliirubri]
MSSTVTFTVLNAFTGKSYSYALEASKVKSKTFFVPFTEQEMKVIEGCTGGELETVQL